MSHPASITGGAPLRTSRVTVLFSHGNVGDDITRLDWVLGCRPCRRLGLEGGRDCGREGGRDCGREGGREEERIRRPSRAGMGMARYMPGCLLGVIYDKYSVRILNPIAAYSKALSSLQYHLG